MCLRVCLHTATATGEGRGLSKNTSAVAHWNTRDYLPHLFGEDINIPLVKDGSVGTLQDDRQVESFAKSFRRVFDSDYSKVSGQSVSGQWQ